MPDPQMTPVTHEQARRSAQKFIDWFFNNGGPRPYVSVPAREEFDDDLILVNYIKQQKEKYG